MIFINKPIIMEDKNINKNKKDLDSKLDAFLEEEKEEKDCVG